MRIINGCYGEDKVATIKRSAWNGSFKRLDIRTGFLSTVQIHAFHIASVVKIEGKSISASGALVGGVVAGLAGAVVGAGMGGVTFLVRLRSGGQFLATGGLKEFQTLLGVAIAPVNKASSRSSGSCLPLLLLLVVSLLTVCIGIPIVGLVVVGLASRTASHSPPTVVGSARPKSADAEAKNESAKSASEVAEPVYEERRTWSDKSGQFSTEAEFVSSENGVVQLKKTNGNVIKVPVEKLSDGDRAFIASVAASDTAQHAPTSKPKQLGSGKDFMVRVQVWDDTERKPIHEKAEIWFRGHGSWWLKPATKSGAAATNLGRREMGVKFTGDDAVQFYPDGRAGPKINIPLMMTAAMNPEGSQRDTIIINIDDAEIEVIGLPIEAAIGKTTLKFDRMTGEALIHIDPILLTAEQNKALQRQMKSSDPSSEIIGRWLDTSPLLGGKITIFGKDGRFFMEYKYNDGSGDITELVETRSQVGRRFDYKPDRGNGEYYLIDSRGDLQELDRGGPFVTFKKLN